VSQWLEEDEHRTWRSFLRMHAQLTAALGHALKADSDMSISDYEVLAILSESPEGALRARDLRCELQWEKSRLAHHIRRMEQRGYVQREACIDDARAPLLCITDVGLAAIREAAPAHVARVRQLVFEALTPAQVRALREATEAVLENPALSELNQERVRTR
jgi:DNA-binding MarR family transcriptional regulator